MSRILVFEDAPSDQQFLLENLEPRFETHIFSDARNCLETTLQLEPDLILINLALRSINVLEAKVQLKKHRATSKIPVVLLSSPQDLATRRNQSPMMAKTDPDDLLLKPLDREQLIGRIERRLTNCLQAAGPDARLKQVGLLSFDPSLGQVFLNCSEVRPEAGRIQIHLVGAELRLLAHFIENVGNVLTRDDIQARLLGSVHGAETVPTNATRYVDSLVFQLRKKLKPVAHYFESVYGRGYRFAPHTEKKFGRRRTRD